ncbi:uncharacterized protein LOC127842790 [Dreissena polymorpha]|uniref:uncharacterized protein LOC127842790 n=1 Tax=Dreissena polymorpha TaxID=45954 RepID=UPI0022652E86|nr:uncharacterized protein LOC127842790 [Dreissena polymorpha]
MSILVEKPRILPKKRSLAKFKYKTSTVSKTNPCGMQRVRKLYRHRGFSTQATDIIMSAWRDSTKCQYKVNIKRWLQYCSGREINPVSVSINDVIEFLTTEYNKGLGYYSLNTARSSLTSLGIIIDNYQAELHPIVVKFIKGVFNLRPPVPKYCCTWDVDKVLNYLRKLSPVKLISLKDLTFKLVILIALAKAARIQTVQLLSVNNLKKLRSKFVVYFDGLLKQSRPSCNQSYIELTAYPQDRRLCVYTVVKEYLVCTKPARTGDNDRLLLSLIKPYKAVSRDTVSRWIKTVMIRSGIDVSVRST